MIDSADYSFPESMHRFKKLFKSIPLPELSHGEFMLLGALKIQGENGCMNVSKLAERMCVSSPSVSRTLGNLEKKQFVERSIDPDNRRSISVRLTKKGDKALENAHNYLCEFMNSVTSEMGEENISELTRLMKLMSEIMERKLSKNNERIIGYDKDT